MDRTLILVGVGGLIGSILRYLVAIFVARHVSPVFPLGTLIVNLIGCFLIGVLIALSERGNIITPEWRIFLATGFCGGFTTFSAFSYESIRMLQDGQILLVSLNVAISIIVGFAATYLGMLLVRSV